MGVNHTLVSRRAQWCSRVVTVVIRHFALKKCLWQTELELRMRSDHRGWGFFLCYDTHGECNTKNLANL